jgi:hypothetical protein
MTRTAVAGGIFDKAVATSISGRRPYAGARLG